MAKVSLYEVSLNELAHVDLDIENASHREFVADCLAKATKSDNVTITGVTSSSVEYYVSAPRVHAISRLRVPLLGDEHVIEMQLQKNDATQDVRAHSYEIFGASVLERVRFRNVAPVPFAPIVMEPALLADLGIDGTEMLDGAKLTIVYGSVLMRVSDAKSEEHAARIMSWALATREVAEAVEATIAEHVGNEPGIVSLLAHNRGPSVPPPPIQSVGNHVFAEVTFDEPITDTSGKALAQMINASVRALTGSHITCLFTSRTLPFLKSFARESCWQYLKRTHAKDFEWHSADQSSTPSIVLDMLYAREGYGSNGSNPHWCLPMTTRKPLAVFCAESEAVLTKAWSVIAQILKRSPRDDLPAVSEPRKDVIWHLPQQPNESWLCVLQSGCSFDAKKMLQLVELVRLSPHLEVIDLCRAKGDGITVDAIQLLLNCQHVRYVAIAGAEQCDTIRKSVDVDKATGRLICCSFPQFMNEIADRSGPDYHAHRRFFSFRRAATESIRDIRGNEILALAGAREVERQAKSKT